MSGETRTGGIEMEGMKAKKNTVKMKVEGKSE